MIPCMSDWWNEKYKDLEQDKEHLGAVQRIVLFRFVVGEYQRALQHRAVLPE